MEGSGAGAMTGGPSLVGLVDEFLADGAPPEDLGLDDVELVVVFLADFLSVAGVGEDLVVDDDFSDEDFEVPGEAVSFGVAGFWSA